MLRCIDCTIEWDEQRARKCADGNFRCKSCVHKRNNLKYNHSNKGRLSTRRFSKTNKFKLNQRKYNLSDKGKAKTARHYWADPEYQRLKSISKNHGVEPDLLVFIRNRDKVCQLCYTDQNLTFDHIHPVSRGGNGTLENLQILCQPCNSFKNNHLFLPGGGMIVSI